MIRFLIRTLIFFVSAAVGLLVAAALLDDVTVTASGFFIVVVVFAVIQTIIAPFLARVAQRNASALLGGIGLISTFVALVLAVLIGDSLTIDGGAVNWLATTVIVWLATALATLLLPILLVKAGVESARERRN